MCMVSKTEFDFTMLTLIVGPFVFVFIVGLLIGLTIHENRDDLISKDYFDDQQIKLKVCAERQAYNFDAYMNASVDLQNCKEDLYGCAFQVSSLQINVPCKT